MNATDTTTASTAREGSPTMDTTVTAETIEAPVQLAKTPRRRGFVYEPMTAAVPASRLTLTEDGHAADPGQLLGLLVDADARNASSGLAYLAEHTAAADLAPVTVLPSSTHRALTNNAAYVTEHGITPAQAKALGIVARKVIEDGDPTGAGRQLANVLTAKLRGEGWKAAYGCADWCVMDHAGDDGNPGWHQGAEATIAPLADKNRSPELNHRTGEPEPLLSARVTQSSQDSHIFGVETEVWVWTGGEAYELDRAGVDKMIGAVERFLPQLRAARVLLAEAGKADFPANPVAKAKWNAEQDAKRDALLAANEQTGGAR